VRVLLPGYRDILEQIIHIEVIAECAPKAEIPGCKLGRAAIRDGLPV
jgi:starch synthase